MTTKRIKAGDFVEVALSNGYGYLRCLGKYKKGRPYDVFQVLHNPDGNQIADSGDITKLSSSYLMTTIWSAIADDRLRLIEGTRLSEITLPVFRERYGTGWHLLEEPGKRLVRDLDDKMKRLPLLEAVLPERIISRLETGWRPEQDTLNSTELFQDWVRQAKDKGWKGFTHLVCFVSVPTMEQARAAVGDLTQAGYDARVEDSDKDVEIRVKITPSAGVDIGGEWADRVENEIARITQQFEGSVSGHEFG